MKVVPTNMTVADYCAALQSDAIVINRKYQRNEEIWPDAARSYLIETVLLGYPMPKLCLYQVVDLETRGTVKEIVDGQQRSGALRDFYADDFRLSKKLETEDVAGKTYSELSTEYQEAFLSYQLSIDLFVAATEEDIQEVFRRINAYAAEALPEEQRHARFQGSFKWFIAKLAREYSKLFREAGILTEKSMIRMADCKLLTEICRALDKGIGTTKKEDLDAVYEAYDDGFPAESSWKKMIQAAFDQLAKWPELHRRRIMASYCVYTLVLAIIHVRYDVESLESVFDAPKKKVKFDGDTINRLLTLDDALETEAEKGPYAKFVKACSEKTNVKEQRQTRFVYFCKALTGDVE